MSAPNPPPAFPVLVHDYNSKLVQHGRIYERLPLQNGGLSQPAAGTQAPKNALIFIGGLGDGPHTVPIPAPVARLLGEQLPGWSVFEMRLNSSVAQWGFSSLKEDVREIGEVVAYLRERLGRERVVLMGHSTGSQDCMEYAVKGQNELPRVDGIILQGPVSDREAFVPLLKRDGRDPEESLAYAARVVKEGRGDEEYMPRRLLPVGWNTPITAYRWHSLISSGGDDDYFSSDLPDDRVAETWGSIKTKVLIVPSEKDENIPEHVDVVQLIRKWMAACKPGVASDLSGLITGANHRVEYPEGQQWLAERVVGFLQEIAATEGEVRRH